MALQFREKFACGSPKHDELWNDVNFFRLTFRDSGLEDGFTRDRASRVISTLRLAALLWMLPLVLVIPSSLLAMDRESEALREVIWKATLFQIGILVLSGSCFLFTFAAPLHRVMRPVVVEVVVTLGICLGLWLHNGAVAFFQARLSGHDPYEIPGSKYLDVDTDRILIIDAIVTGVHLFLPIRNCILIILQVGGVLSYLGPAAVLVTPFAEKGTLWWYGMWLVLLTTMAHAGKRHLEKQERLQFLTLIRERTLRVQSEFELSRMQQRGAGKGAETAPRRPRSSVSSSAPSTAPSTNASDKVFEYSGNDEELLASITEIGIKEQWLVNPHELQSIGGDSLGEGGFGVVRKGLYHGSVVAVKSPKTGTSGMLKKSRFPELCNELRIMRRLRHPNIVFMYGAMLELESPSGSIRLSLVMEMVAGKSLDKFLASATSGSSGETTRLELLLHIASALCYLHTRRPAVVHGDLKSGNVFVEGSVGSGFKAKLLDFGLSTRLTASAPPLGGTQRWAAPELFGSGTLPSRAADVFSFGRIMYFVATAKLPFQGVERKEMARLTKAGTPPPWPEECASGLSADYRPLVEQCCHTTAEKRPKIRPLFQSLVAMIAKVTGYSSGTGGEIRADSSSTLFSDLGKVESPTAAEAAGEDPLAPGSLEKQSPQGQAKQRAVKKVHAEFQPTPSDTMVRSLALTILQWNHTMPADGCCFLHGGLQVVGRVSKQLGQLPCDIPVSICGQCVECGLLRLEGEDFCPLCGRAYEDADDSPDRTRASASELARV